MDFRIRATYGDPLFGTWTQLGSLEKSRPVTCKIMHNSSTRIFDCTGVIVLIEKVKKQFHVCNRIDGGFPLFPNHVNVQYSQHHEIPRTNRPVNGIHGHRGNCKGSFYTAVIHSKTARCVCRLHSLFGERPSDLTIGARGALDLPIGSSRKEQLLTIGFRIL